MDTVIREGARRQRGVEGSGGGQGGTGADTGTGATVRRREAGELEVVVIADALATDGAKGDGDLHQPCQASTGQSSFDATHQSAGRV